MTEKEALYTYCLDYVQQRIKRIQDEITRTQLSANEETKSSAGDKYETSRAMAQLEIERSAVQLQESEKLLTVLQSISTFNTPGAVSKGSLVATSRGVFYIAISLGPTEITGKQYLLVSADSPIGKLMMGKQMGESISWQGQDYTIQNIK